MDTPLPSGRQVLKHVLADAPKNLVFYGAIGLLAGWLAPRAWWLAAGIFGLYAVIVLLDVLQHLGLAATLPVLWFRRAEPKADVVAETVATFIRLVESGLLLWLGYLTYLKLSQFA